ncbi:SPOR domain-containing protein [Mongoliimonas terrestris]|uniref:SPOR domain-containing protein n=1 Tax=Mongoliimonas terrestris TaxID=1709001 RepID=UPI000AD919EA|nr:SPOR domain-containing protein [Mongoliimonas terrestris]
MRSGANDPFDPLGPEEGEPSGFVVLAWSALAAVALLMAMVAWQYGAPDRNVAARTLNDDATYADEITGSIDRIGVTSGRGDLSTTDPAGPDGEADLGALKVENAGLRHTVEVLRGQMDGLSERVALLEERLGDLTGSVSAPDKKSVRTTQITATPPVPVTNRDRAALASDPPVSRTQFGVELGTYRDLASVQAGWRTLRSGKPELFGGLNPLATVRDRGGRTELLLVAGPFANAQAAADLCARATADGIACLPAFYLGQPLALR